MLADRAEFTGHTSTGPQKLNTVTCSALRTNAFRLFLAQTDGLNAFDSLFSVADSLFFFHCQPPHLRVGIEGS
jgi:hypothetical protein